ncbi:isocitrate lyase/phosphoenolpyruvate mutase family protein [Rummeliibacillus stabekisii]|uniref:isocitrate lyase/PEP mutase family protein n=1 Tax=Rummeliibacillus stabekisii TaxID=241244 RepID=UPI002041E659|nr:isocitrate lyase/phosphoenolpyruvate mutase family protein [Rummeliibacillus stabekisii]MCM3317596.1 isocitrate lyase/phosphoenolpyruvate mutase family protein [Rummeliibacillus stabekisii]
MNTIQTFNELHHAEEPLFLGNAWDLLSALTLEKAGFKAIGTTSWGIANSLGFADGELIDFDRHLTVIKTIAENVNIPVSADIEAGYSEDTNMIIENVLRTAEVGVAGINIEDSKKKTHGLKSISQHASLLEKIRLELDHRGFKDFFINARMDTYLQKENPLPETMERARAYLESGASGIFVPGIKEDMDIKELTMSVSAPVNILSLPGVTNYNHLKELGVRRFSFGNALSDIVIAYLEKKAGELLEHRDTFCLYETKL